MKNLYFFSVGVLIFIQLAETCLTAQKNSFKFGKIDKSELEMNSYQKDTAAVALILREDAYTYYDYSNNQFKVVTEVIKRIKILKQEGVEKATITLNYYCGNSSCDNITKIEAYSYNLENNNITKTKLDKKYIFEEKISERYKQKKFAIPNVKTGSVIEYRYTVSTENYFDLPDWLFQYDIPVSYSRYEVLIPEYFNYNIESRGFERIETYESDTIQNFYVQNSNTLEPVTCKSRKLVYTIHDIPAMTDEKHVWCVRDFMTGLRFELSGTNFPYSFYKPYSQTWDDIEKTIKEHTDFVSNINKSNPYKKEISALLSSVTDDKKKIEIIYQFLKEKIRWNESYAFTSNPSEAVKEGTGNNAQINAVLISMLKDAGINSYPVLISRRSLGRLPFTYPSLDQLNTFVVMAVCSDGQRCYMDGSAYYGGINMLPTDLLVDRARIYGSDEENKWIDLTGITKNQIVNLIAANIGNDGSINGTYTTLYLNQPAYSFKKMFNELKDSAEYVEKLCNELTVKIDSMQIDGQHNLLAGKVSRKINFIKINEGSTDYLYINPLIFPHFTQNDFTQSDRKLPIEFSYPYNYSISSVIRIPENYTIEEIPQSGKMVLNDNTGTFTYLIKQFDNKSIQVNYRFELNQTIIPQTLYKPVQEFWGEIAAKNSALLVLKKQTL